MLSLTPEPRLRMVDHEWYSVGAPIDFESPPSGRRIHAIYSNGDRLTIAFWDAQSPDTFRERYTNAAIPESVRFPVTVAEVAMTIGGSNIRFGSDKTKVGGIALTDNWFIGNRVGLTIG